MGEESTLIYIATLQAKLVAVSKPMYIASKQPNEALPWQPAYKPLRYINTEMPCLHLSLHVSFLPRALWPRPRKFAITPDYSQFGLQSTHSKLLPFPKLENFVNQAMSPSHDCSLRWYTQPQAGFGAKDGWRQPPPPPHKTSYRNCCFLYEYHRRYHCPKAVLR